MAFEYQTIRLLFDDLPIARILLNQPEKRNALTQATIGELCHALGVIAERSDARVVVLKGAGDVFCAGGDLSAMLGETPERPPSIPPASIVDLFKTMHLLGKPIIAAVNGHALAGGMGLMVACDLVVASDAATFGLPEISVGLWPMIITAELVRNIGRKKTLELMLTGKRVSAEEAERIGLINCRCKPESLDEHVEVIAGAIADKSPATLALGLRTFYGIQDEGYEQALLTLESQLDKVLALEDAHEGMTAFLERRKPEWKGR